jgi:UPF0716 protein FxsA
MFLNFLAVLLLVFLADLFILVQIGGRIGFWPVFGILVIFGAYGFTIIKSEGFSVIRSIKWDIKGGIIPGKQLLNALMKVVGGILFMIPGFISSLIGALLILPGTRGKLLEWLLHYISSKIGLGLLNINFRNKKRRLK